jgi:hypothetical protein
MFRPPLFSLQVRIVPKLHPTLDLVRPLICITAIQIYGCTLALRPTHRVLTRTTRGGRAPHPPPHLGQRHLHRRSHLSISLLLLRAVREMKDVLIQSGRSLCGRGAGVADGFVGTQEGGDLCGRGEAGEEVAEDGCVFDLWRG